MIELEKNGYFELAKAKERDPGLYEQVVGKDTVGRPKEMKFSDVLMRCFMQEKDPDTGERRIDKSLVSNRMKDPSDPSYEEEDEEEEEEEDEAEKEEEVPIADLINEDLSPEERQEEFLNMMKQRFVDGKDPEYDYETLALARDTVKDSDLTDAWFDEEDEAVVSSENETKKNPPSDTESEDDYMTMDLSKL